MSHVDPLVVPIPDKWRYDKQIGPFMDYMMRFWYDLWVRTGAGDDHISNQSIREVYPWTVDEDKNDLSYIRFDQSLPELDVISTAVNRTTAGDEINIVTSTVTISLNAIPNDLEAVHIKHATTGTVTISGNGNTIDGETTILVYKKYTSLHIIYSVDAGEWLIV